MDVAARAFGEYHLQGTASQDCLADAEEGSRWPLQHPAQLHGVATALLAACGAAGLPVACTRHEIHEEALHFGPASSPPS